MGKYSQHITDKNLITCNELLPVNEKKKIHWKMAHHKYIYYLLKHKVCK